MCWRTTLSRPRPGQCLSESVGWVLFGYCLIFVIILQGLLHYGFATLRKIIGCPLRQLPRQLESKAKAETRVFEAKTTPFLGQGQGQAKARDFCHRGILEVEGSLRGPRHWLTLIREYLWVARQGDDCWMRLESTDKTTTTTGKRTKKTESPEASPAMHRWLHGMANSISSKLSWNAMLIWWRAFCFAGPYVWNSLPEHILQSTSIFKRSLKTFLLQQISHLAH